MENQENKVTNENNQESKSGKSFKPFATIAAVLLIAFLGFGVILFLKGNKNEPQQTQVQGESIGVTSKANTGTGNIKEFTISGSNFKFEPNQIKVNKGDTVKITFKDDDGTHNLVVDGYGVSTRIISGGTDTLEFIADKTGNFEYYCSIGAHRDLGMKGILTVE